MLKTSVKILAGFVFLLALSTVAHADTVAVTPSVSFDISGADFTVGYEFSPTENIDVTSLGSWFGASSTVSDGVSIWTSTGTLIDTTAVAPGGTSAGFYYASISPLLLTAGTDYVIGSTVNGNYLDCTGTCGPAVASGISLLSTHDLFNLAGTGTTPVFPTSTDSGFAIGPNFTFTPATTATPEPSSIALLFSGLLFVGLLAGVKRYRGHQLVTAA